MGGVRDVREFTDIELAKLTHSHVKSHHQDQQTPLLVSESQAFIIVQMQYMQSSGPVCTSTSFTIELRSDLVQSCSHLCTFLRRRSYVDPETRLYNSEWQVCYHLTIIGPCVQSSRVKFIVRTGSKWIDPVAIQFV